MNRMTQLICTAALSLTFALGMKAQSVRFRPDHKLKIVQFTDIHWVPGKAETADAAACMNEVLDAEKPDFVIYTGDITTGKPAAEALDKALEPVLSRHIPFGITFGNHDDEQDLTRRQLFELVKKKPGNLTATVDGLSGVANYIVPVASADGKKTEAVLYVIDSNAYSPLKQIKGYDWIKPDQVEWYRKESSKFAKENGGKPLPALAFFHIPFPEYNLAASDESARLVGTRGEKACSPAVNTGMFAAMINAGDVMGTFVGHDHVNNYVVERQGILLCYGQFTGGKTTYHPQNNGARVIELTEGVRGFKTWIRMRGGKVINEVTWPDDFEKKD